MMCTPKAAITTDAPPRAIIPYLIFSSVLMADPREGLDLNFGIYMKVIKNASMYLLIELPLGL